MSKFYVTCSWDQCPHLDEDQKKNMLDALPPYQRDARTKGIPSMGSGVIYPVSEEFITVKPFEIPKHWKHVYGMDVGWNNTAAIFAAIDPDNDIVYFINEYKRGNVEPTVHAAAVKSRAKGDTKPGVIDPASKGRSQIDGENLLSLYRELGLNLTPANNAVESGIYEVWERLTLGKLKVFSTCQLFLEEYRMYRRDEKGKIVKQNDHCMDALRYLIMTGIDIAKPENPKPNKTSFSPRNIGTWMGI